MNELDKAILDEVDRSHLPEIGLFFRGRREELGLTQKKLAKLVGTSQAQVSYWEGGASNIKFETLQRWARALGYVIEVHVNTVEEVLADDAGALHSEETAVDPGV